MTQSTDKMFDLHWEYNNGLISLEQLIRMVVESQDENVQLQAKFTLYREAFELGQRLLEAPTESDRQQYDKLLEAIRKSESDQ